MPRSKIVTLSQAEDFYAELRRQSEFKINEQTLTPDKQYELTEDTLLAIDDLQYLLSLRDDQTVATSMLRQFISLLARETEIPQAPSERQSTNLLGARPIQPASDQERLKKLKYI